MSNDPAHLIACHECDLLQREIHLPFGGEAHCRRCGALLYRSSPGTFENTLPFALAAAILFVIANIYPLFGIDINGNTNASHLFGAVRYLWNHEMHLVSILVSVTTMVIPAIEIALMLYLMVFFRLNVAPVGAPLFLRVLQNVKPWSMIEVFMLGILVALVKLKDTSTIIPGVALWSFGGLTLMLAAVASSFNPRDLWLRIGHLNISEKHHE